MHEVYPAVRRGSMNMSMCGARHALNVAFEKHGEFELCWVWVRHHNPNFAMSDMTLVQLISYFRVSGIGQYQEVMTLVTECTQVVDHYVWLMLTTTPFESAEQWSQAIRHALSDVVDPEVIGLTSNWTWGAHQ